MPIDSIKTYNHTTIHTNHHGLDRRATTIHSDRQTCTHLKYQWVTMMGGAISNPHSNLLLLRGHKSTLGLRGGIPDNLLTVWGRGPRGAAVGSGGTRHTHNSRTGSCLPAQGPRRAGYGQDCPNRTEMTWNDSKTIILLREF